MNRILSPILLLALAMPAWGQDQESIAKNTRIAKQSATISGDRGTFTVSRSLSGIRSLQPRINNLQTGDGS